MRLKYMILTSVMLAAYMIIQPVYTSYKYAHLYGKSVVRILGKRGGGTGFQVEFKGHTFIMTNDHVCGLADENGALLIDSPFARIQNSYIQYRSATTDLCLLNPVDDLPALKLGQEEFLKGETITVLGHPLLGKITASRGKVLRTGYIDVMLDYIHSDQEERECSLPKNRIHKVFFGLFKVCTIHVRAQDTTALIYPGNSGSPVLDNHGFVKGVAFASEKNHRGDIIPLNDMRKFLNASLEHAEMREVY